MTESDASYDVPVYEQRSPIYSAISAGSTSAGVGLLVSAVQNSLQKHKAGAMGIFTRTGSTIALFTLVGGAFAYADAFTSNTRNKSDGWNGAAGGCASGLVIGAASRSMPMMAGSCAGLGALIGTFQAAGNTLLNQANIKPPKPLKEKPDAESPLMPTAQVRRAGFLKPAQGSESE